MDKCKNVENFKIAVVISFKAAGMDKYTIGTTYVVYKYEEDNLDYPFIMEHKEFYRKHSKINN